MAFEKRDFSPESGNADTHANCCFDLKEKYRCIEEILRKSLQLLKALALGNEVVQLRMFDRLDTLLTIKGVESELAIALKEVRLLFFFYHFLSD